MIHFGCVSTVLTVGCLMAPPKGIDVGGAMPDFADLPTANGQTVSAKDFPQDVLVLVITTNECPVARLYEARFVDFVNKHQKPEGKVALLAVNAYDSEGNTLEDMKARVAESKLNYTYAQDVEQKLSKAIGATNTPHVFVFDKERKLVYKGAFDDNWSDPTAVKHRYVEDAVVGILNGGSVPKPTKPEGCPIHYDR